MNSKKPLLINDSVLANAVYDLLKKQNVPLSSSLIADEVFAIENLPSDLADKMLYTILETDARFVCDVGNKWSLSVRETGKQKLKKLQYVVIDVEIVGHASCPQIIEIAAYRLEELKIVDNFCTFVNPGRAIIPKILPQMNENTAQIITTELLQEAPTFEDMVTDFFQFIGDGILVAHNAHFDLRMINRELKRLGRQKLVNRTIDTLKITRRLFRGIDTQKLPNVAYYFGVSMEQHHLAKDDALVLAKIFPFLIEILADQQIIYFDQLDEFTIRL